MRKWSARFLVCLALGLLTTVAVACFCALWSVVWPSRYGTYREVSAGPGERLPLEQLGELVSIIDPSQLPPTPLSEPTAASLNEESGFGLYDSNLDIVYFRDDPSRFRGQSVAFRHRAGWPLAALGCACTYRGDGWPATPAWMPPPWLARPAYTVLTNRAGIPVRIAGARLPVPLRPIPFGFAADSVLFAAAYLSLSLTPSTARALRTRLRLRRGQCAACGYSLAGLPPGAACPECGKGAAC